jgi:hypothetical protein
LQTQGKAKRGFQKCFINKKHKHLGNFKTIILFEMKFSKGQITGALILLGAILLIAVSRFFL